MESEPESLLAARLLERAAAAAMTGLIFVARSETRAARLHAAAAALAGQDAEALLLPAWDCLPYDRVSPSRGVMGARMAAVAALAERARRPRLLVASVEAATQRLPRAADAGVALETGAAIDPDALRDRLERLGYVLDDSADEPGEVAVRGAVVDVFAASGDAASAAVRVHHEEGRITALRPYDPATQRSADEVEAVTLRQASELVLPEDSEERHRPGLEHALPAFCPDLAAPLDLLPGAALVLDPEVERAVPQRAADVAEAFRTRLALRPPNPEEPPPEPPERLYLDEAAWKASLAGREVSVLEEGEARAELPDFLSEEEPEEAFVDFVEAALRRRRRVGLVGRGRAAAALARLAAERLDVEPKRLGGWLSLRAAPRGAFALLDGELDEGFAADDAAVVPVGKVRPRRRARGQADGVAALAEAVPGLQPGDAVIHFEHGLGELRGVEPVDTGEANLDCLRLAYAADTARLVPFDELDRIWRYGAAAENVTLDRLGSEAWAKRRAEAEAQVAETAKRMLQLAREREGAAAPALRPPRDAYARFADRFPFPLTPDQAGAIADTLRDMASGRPMDRLVCGDVGFGKTEVALRAAAAAALSGKQVAVLAPTTVLVRQHLETFRKRFAGLGLRVASLSRLTSPADAKETKKALADGAVHVCVGTQALAAKGVRFRDLGLVVIDEEQRFGTRQKAALRELGEGVHVLTLTATPIPRTLQSALVGLQSLSVIATPPARRQPIRTARAPMDDALLVQALRREARRGGQSFVVCPRIEDIGPMRERIAGLLPDLSLLVAHGDMPPAEVDEALVRFAAGDGDVLLSTNIVETGLDVPRANTMLVWRPDRFGLSQLHQLRGRVGRGRARGAVYLLTDPAAPPTPATERRLRTLEALDRVGAGFAISARDLDLRGAGDLLGEEQAGHLRLVGIELYRHMLERALAAARGEAPPEQWTPQLGLNINAFIPPEHVPEEALRVELHTRLGEVMRRADLRALEDMADEAQDRFGPPPEPFRNLLALARLAILCRRLGVARLEAGPQAAAASFRGAAPPAKPPLEESKGRLILRRQSADAAERLEAAEAVLAALLPRRRRREAA